MSIEIQIADLTKDNDELNMENFGQERHLDELINKTIELTNKINDLEKAIQELNSRLSRLNLK